MEPVLVNVVLAICSSLRILPQACCITKRLVESYTSKGKCFYMHMLKLALEILLEYYMMFVPAQVPKY